MERIKTNVTKETGDAIREYGLDGVKVDEDSRRYYPFGNLASKVIGFTGSDNQGLEGIESRYDNVLKGKAGKILKHTDAAYEKKITKPIHRVFGIDFLKKK